jgi:hypothetical protein
VSSLLLDDDNAIASKKILSDSNLNILRSGVTSFKRSRYCDINFIIFSMKNLVIILTILFLLPFSSMGQGFSFVDTATFAHSSMVIHKDQIILGSIMDSSNIQGIRYTVMDTNGVILRYKDYFRDSLPSHRLVLFLKTPFVVRNDSLLYHLLYKYTSPSSRYIALAEINLKTLAMKYTPLSNFGNDISFAEYIQDMIVVDSTFYLASNYIFLNSGVSPLHVFAIDKYGRKIWSRMIHKPNRRDFGTYIRYHQNKLKVLSNDGPQTFSTACTSRTNIRYTELDLNGNVIKIIDPAFTKPEAISTRFITDEAEFMDNKGVLLVSEEGSLRMEAGDCQTYVQAIISRRDTNFVTTFRRYLEPKPTTAEAEMAWSLKKSPDGNFIIAGTSFDSTSLGKFRYLLIEKVDEYGTRIWKRIDTIFSIQSGYRPLLTFLQVLSSGSIVVSGILDPIFARIPAYGFTYKTDPNGCVSWIRCGLITTDINEVNPELMATELSVFPNPSFGSMTVNILGLWEPDMTYEIFDIFGKNVKTIAVSGIESILNVEDLVQGSYFIILRKNGNIHGTTKFLKL